MQQSHWPENLKNLQAYTNNPNFAEHWKYYVLLDRQQIVK
jgi:hypothetical protein